MFHMEIHLSSDHVGEIVFFFLWEAVQRAEELPKDKLHM